MKSRKTELLPSAWRCRKKSMSSQHAGRQWPEVPETMKHRWPKSLHSQVEAIFHSIRSFRETKTDNAFGVRSFGSWKTYKYEAHRFVEYLLAKRLITLLDTLSVRNGMVESLEK